MKIIQEVRGYATSPKPSEAEALQKGIEAKAVEFVKQGTEIYSKTLKTVYLPFIIKK